MTSVVRLLAGSTWPWFVGCIFACLIFAANVAGEPLFNVNQSSRQWSQFDAIGFQAPVSGIIYRSDALPCCGVALGGISTGCLDFDPNGTFGFCTIFNGYPRQPKLAAPFLGLSVSDKTWVLATEKVIRGGLLESCVEKGKDPYYPERQSNPGFWHAIRPRIQNVRAAKEIHFWGHYPVADAVYETNSPVAIEMRSWSPFIPGDIEASDIPAAVFEVRLNNISQHLQKCAVAMSFPAPLQDAKRETYGDRSTHVTAPPVFERRKLQGAQTGNVVSIKEFSYVLGVLEKGEHVRLGGALSELTWHAIGKSLPAINDGDSGSSVAMDFILKPGETRIVRFVIAWQVPTWGERGTTWHRMNAKHFPTVDDVVSYIAEHHVSLLERILSWQEVVYAATEYPPWLKDCLINSLALIPECAYYAQPTGPLERFEDGLFGMMEAPRVCPQIECIPCSWYGNMPIVYFFPKLARTTLEGYREYQRDDGAAPFVFGHQSDMRQAIGNDGHDSQIMLNGVCYVDMVYRMWQRTGDDELLKEYYDSVKRSTTLTATMGEAPYPVVGFPPGDNQTEWWEGWPWTGIATHAAGMHLSSLLAAERMAEAVGDQAFAEQCRAWFRQGSDDLEKYNWRDGSYLLFNRPQTSDESDKIMSNQLDGQWANRFLGIVDDAFQRGRIDQALDTIRKTCFHPLVGAVSFASREGGQELTTYGIFPPETLILGMTYMYHAQKEVGLQICKQCMENIVLRQGKEWDMPNMVNGDTGEVRFGTDYYQMMILWAVPAAIESKGIGEFCAAGGLIDRILKAGAKPTDPKLPVSD